MKKSAIWLLVSLIISTLLLACVEYLWPKVPFAKEFASKFGGNMFSGFLTLGGFLLAMKNLVVLRLQEKIYDTDGYRELFERECKEGEGLYDPLVNLTGLLVGSVGACLASAVLMLIAGYTESPILALSALGFSVSSLSLVFKCWWEMHGNFQAYFIRLEKEYQGKKTKTQIKAADDRDKNKI